MPEMTFDEDALFDGMDRLPAPSRFNLPGRRALILISAVAVVVIVAVVLRPDGNVVHNLQGTVALEQFVFAPGELVELNVQVPDAARKLLPQGSPCVAGSRYKDIVEGTEVTIRDGNNGIIADGTITGSGLTDIEMVVDMNGEGPQLPGRCIFPFMASNVPKTKFYKIELGQRDGPTFSYDDMTSEGWKPRLTLGGQ